MRRAAPVRLVAVDIEKPAALCKSLQVDSTKEYLTTKELADLLRIKERKVYDLAASGDVPCSKAMGKLLFPRKDVEAWLAGSSTGPSAQKLPDRPSVFLGSHDPLLDWALRESRSGIATFFDGSVDGLSRSSVRPHCHAITSSYAASSLNSTRPCGVSLADKETHA